MGGKDGTSRHRTASYNDSHVVWDFRGASGNQADFEDNERLIMAAIVRMASMGDVPYYICMDGNINPAHSQVIQKAIEAQVAYDIVADAFGGKPHLHFAGQEYTRVCKAQALLE